MITNYPIGGGNGHFFTGGGPGDGGDFLHAVLEGHDIS